MAFRTSLLLTVLLVVGCGPTESERNNLVVITTTNGSNNASANNPTTTNHTAGSNNAPVDEVAEKCSQYCEILVGDCVLQNCSLDSDVEAQRDAGYQECVGGSEQGCRQRYEGDESFAATVDLLARQTCADEVPLELRCQLYDNACDCPPALGAACEAHSDCFDGGLQGACMAQDGRFNPGGQCIAFGCAVPDGQDAYYGSTTGCGPDGFCQRFGDGPDEFTSCVWSCRQNADCGREGYACLFRSAYPTDGTYDEVPVGVCDTACRSEDDCVTVTGRVCGENGACQQICESDAGCPEGLVCTGISLGGTSHCMPPEE